MIHDTFRQIEARLGQAEALKPEQRQELLGLVDDLRREVAALQVQHPDEAASIAGFAAVSTHEATRAHPHPPALQFALRGLASTVEEFEQAHPRLIDVVNRVSTTLANLGI